MRGPFARLRLENHVEAGAHIGNFVELKKTRMGAGAKAGHLAYLGDAEIGPGVNVGAGTITCNYDGSRKYPTKIGPGAFIGSNSTLVAPVEVGAGAYLAAGSVITTDVPADALGTFGRARPGEQRRLGRRTPPARSGRRGDTPGERALSCSAFGSLEAPRRPRRPAVVSLEDGSPAAAQC